METITYIDTTTLKKNQTSIGIYQKPINYDSIKENIATNKIIDPLIVNKATMVIIAGNLRHQIAEELGFDSVPVILREVDEEDMDFLAISSNQYREKTYTEKLNEIKFFEKYYNIKKGQRTDLDKDLKKKKDQRDQALSYMSNDTIDKLKSIDKIANDLYGAGSDEYKKVLKKLDDGNTTLHNTHQHLIKKQRIIINDMKIPEHFQIDAENAKVYQKSSDNMSEIKSESIHTIITSPPYYRMVDYGTGKEQLGMESSVDTYLDNIMKVFQECFRVLRNDGSLFVNINDSVDNKQYNAVPQRFMVRMLKMGWKFNDEILWVKRNPQYTHGKRTVRSHEPIFHFVKSEDFFFNDQWLAQMDYYNDKIVYGVGNSNAKLFSALDFRDGVLKTNVANTSELRKKCLDKGFHLTHSATFPEDLVELCAKLTTRYLDTILDPFAGTSTTGKWCLDNFRKYVGYEVKPEFIMASDVNMEDTIGCIERGMGRLEEKRKQWFAESGLPYTESKEMRTFPQAIHRSKWNV